MEIGTIRIVVTKIHIAVASFGMPVRIVITSGTTIADSSQALKQTQY